MKPLRLGHKLQRKIGEVQVDMFYTLIIYGSLTTLFELIVLLVLTFIRGDPK